MARGEHEVVLGLQGGTAVTLTGRGDDLGLGERCGIRTRDSQPYHRAQELALEEAERHIAEVMEESIQRATDDLRALLDRVRAGGATVRRAGLVVKHYRLPATLAATLRSHPACHGAEGQMTTDALSAACEAVGLEVVAAEAGRIDPRVEGIG